MNRNFCATFNHVRHFHSGKTTRLLLFGLLLLSLATAGLVLKACGPDSIVKYTDQRILDTGYYQLRATHHIFLNPGGAGGGIAYIAGKWLVVSGNGALRLFERTDTGDDFRIRKLPYHVPLNRERFTTAALSGAKRKQLMSERFRVTDVLLHRSDRKLQLWVSHHWWHEQKSCFTLQVSTTVVDADAFLDGSLPAPEWSTLYETTPCLELTQPRFSGQESGGRMVLSGNPPDTLYLTVGDHGFNGKRSPGLAQDPEASWDK